MTFWDWLNSKNVSSKSIAAACGVVALAITSSTELQQVISDLFKSHPVVGVDILLVATAIAKLSHSSKKLKESNNEEQQ